MDKRLTLRLISLCLAIGVCTVAGDAQEQRNDWPMAGVDAGQSGWQKDELGLKPDTIAGNFKYLWKFEGNGDGGESSKGPGSFSEPLLIGRVINGQGFKDIVFFSSGDTLYAVDSELGSLIWKKQYGAVKGSSGCESARLGLLMEPPVTINFNSRRKRKPGTPRPPDPPALTGSERRIGAAPGGGYFGFKGIYVLTADGMLHEQIVTTGADFAPPVKFLPAGGAVPNGLNFLNKVIYTAKGNDCGGVENGLWSIDLTSGNYEVKSYVSGKVHPIAGSGPILTAEGDSVYVTGPGASDGSGQFHPGSVVSVSPEMEFTDWYTPRGGMAVVERVSPIVFDFDSKQVIAAPGADGRVALLNAAALGGADHQTPLFESAPLAKPGAKHGWDGFASWTDKDGATWLYASVSSPITSEIAPKDGGVTLHGENAHGGVVAFKIEAVNGTPSLRPVWVSEDMVNPAPPRIANGVVVVLAGGDKSTNAVLHVLNAATGAGLFSSKKEIPTYAHLSGVAIGDSHAFFTDHNDVLYSFGIGLEH